MVVQILGLLSAWAFLKSVPAPPIKMETAPSIIWFLAAFAIITIAIILLLKYFKFPKMYSGFFAFVIFIGAEAIFSIFLPVWLAVISAAGIVALRFVWPNVATQNLAVIVGVAGVGAQIGILLNVWAVIALLAVLSIYDYIAVFRTRHMVEMFKGLMEQGTALAIVIPESFSGFGKKMEMVSAEKMKEKSKRNFLMLGTGDLAFPLIFSVAALDISIYSAIAVIVGSLFGIFMIHWLITAKKIKALPALPPLAFCSIVGFGISLLFL